MYVILGISKASIPQSFFYISLYCLKDGIGHGKEEVIKEISQECLQDRAASTWKLVVSVKTQSRALAGNWWHLTPSGISANWCFLKTMWPSDFLKVKRYRGGTYRSSDNFILRSISFKLRNVYWRLLYIPEHICCWNNYKNGLVLRSSQFTVGIDTRNIDTRNHQRIVIYSVYKM